MTVTNVILDALLALLIDTDEQLDGAELGLFTNAPVLSPDMVIADLTVPTFTGYLPVAVEGWAAFVDAGGVPYVRGLPVTFSPSDAVDLPQVIQGAYLFKGTDLLAVSMFDSSVALVRSSQALHATPQLQLSGGELSMEAYVA